MPSSQAAAAERRNDRMIAHEPPKLKTTLKTPPKQATNPLQFVKVGPCSLYRTAQEQLQKVQEVKKIKQEVRDDPEDWQSNLDNWKSSRRKRQEHIIERVVEVKKLELEEHDRQRRRSKTFSEMMEERGNRGRKLSISLAMYHEEDANDLSDLGIGTSSGKSSVSGDTHDDTHSVLSDRDSEIEKNHSDLENPTHENLNNETTAAGTTTTTTTTMTLTSSTTATNNANKKASFNNGFHNHNHNSHQQQEYDSATTATTSSPEPEEYTYEGAIRGYVSRVSQNIPRRSLAQLDAKLESASKLNAADDKNTALSAPNMPVVKIDILKRREIFEKASQKQENSNKCTGNNINNNNNNSANRLSGDFTNTKSIKERLSNLEKQNSDQHSCSSKSLNRLSGDMSSIRERLSHLEKQATERENKNLSMQNSSSSSSSSSAAGHHHKLNNSEEFEVRPLRERLSTLEKYSSSDESSTTGTTALEGRQHNGDLTARSIKDRLTALETVRNKEVNKRTGGTGTKHPLCFRDPETRTADTSTPSERSSSPDSEYRVTRGAIFHRSLDSLDADASSGPDTFERVQSLEELDYTRRYHPTSSSSAELLNDTDREDSGIHTADASCSVSQADENVDDDIHVHEKDPSSLALTKIQESLQEASTNCAGIKTEEPLAEAPQNGEQATFTSQTDTVVVNKDTAETSSGELSTNKLHSVEIATNINARRTSSSSSSSSSSSTATSTSPSLRPIIYQSPKVPPRRNPPEIPKPKLNPSVKTGHDDNNALVVDNSETERKSLIPLVLDTTARNTLSSSSSSTPTTPQNEFNSIPTTPTQETNKTNPGRSKIPTPLPRKTLVAKSLPTSPSSPTSPKIPLLKSRVPTKTGTMTNNCHTIPVPITDSSQIPQIPASSKSLPASPLRSSDANPVDIPSFDKPWQEDAKAMERRRTVVEVCEKVVVPQGEAPTTPPVTPFITVTRIQSDQGTEEQIIAERPEETLVSSVHEEAKNEEEEEEEEEEQDVAIVTMNTPEPVVTSPKEANLQQSNGNQIEEILESTSTPIGSNDFGNDNDNNSSNTNNRVSERPSNLSFGKMDSPFVITTDYLSPISPISKSILPLTLSCDEEIITGLSFPLGPPTSVEPPKEKPPPPPTDISDEENQPVEPLKRLNSTRRIKKELRTRRSDFLGLEGFNDDDLERELSLTKPPDMAAILAEERRIEQLHRRSYDTDSNYEQDSSHERDSGVELGHVEDWTKQPDSPDMSQHSRQSSEPFGASVTSSEEDEITKKEREIIEVLEKEEQWRFGDNRDLHSDIGEKLAHKLRELEEEKMQLERARAQEVDMRHQEETLRKNEDNIRKHEETIRKQHQEEMAKQQEALRESEAKRAEEKRKLQQQKEEEEESFRLQAEKLRIQSELEEKERRAAEIRRQEELRIQAMESHIREQESKALMGSGLSNHEDEYASREVLRVKRELLQLEQEELKRQRSNLAYREQKQQQLAEHLQEQWKSLQDVTHTPVGAVQQSCKHQIPLNYRSSMPNLQMQEGQQRKKPPPPPIPPAKPLRLLERQRDVTIRNSRIPSADSIPQQVDSSLRHSVSAITLSSHAGQQMSRQTLQALSAVPRPRIVQGDQWVQRRKSDVPRGAQDFNYQHWLIQEAEQRRINEKNQRSPVRKSQQQHVTGTSVPFVASPSRPDSKPLPDSVIQTLTQRVQNRAQEKPLTPKRRIELSASQEHIGSMQHQATHQHVFQKPQLPPGVNNTESQEKMLSVSGKKKCSHCGDELGRGAAMIIESLRLFYHMECFKCCVCHVRLGDGLMGTDVRVRNHKLHCHNCYSSDDGVKFSCV